MATFYFNGAVDNDWQTLGNWWQDSAFSVPATVLPTSSDDVIAIANILSNSGSEPTVANFTFNDPNQNYYYISIAITVNGNATFNDNSIHAYSSTVTGNATFNDNSINYGAVTGDAVFNDYAYIDGGTITGDAVFNDNSFTYGTVTGDAVFNDSSYNNYGAVNGDAVFNDSAFNYYGTVNGDAVFNDASYTTPGVTIGTLILGTRTPYPLRYGINNSNILGMI